MKLSLIYTSFVALFAAGQVHAAFVDWTFVDTTNQIASGTLGAITVTLSTTARVPNLFSSGGIVDGNTDGTDGEFSNSWFTPNIPLTDSIGLATSSSFAIHFSPAVTNPTLHLSQLASSTLNFTNATGPISFTLVNSDGHFNIATGASATAIQGQSIAGNASGSLYFAGTYSNIAWYVTTPNQADGMAIQISAATTNSVNSSPQVIFVKAFTVDYSNLLVGSSYQAQASSDLVNWTNWGTPFTATSASYTNTSYQRIANWNQIFFRLVQQ